MQIYLSNWPGTHALQGRAAHPSFQHAPYSPSPFLLVGGRPASSLLQHPFSISGSGVIAIHSSPCPSGGRPATSPHVLLPSRLLLPCWLGVGHHPPYSPSPFFLVRGRPASSLLHPSFEISGLGGDCHQFPTMPFLLPSSSALNG